MFRNKIIRVLTGAEARALIDDAVRQILEDQASNTRQGMMRIVRGEAKDAVQDAQERARTMAELDPGYQEWAQQRRQALMERENDQQAALLTYARTGIAPQLRNPLDEYPVGRPVLVLDDALFGGRYGHVVGTSEDRGYPEVRVMLEGHTVWMTFTPGALRPVAITEAAPPAPAGPDEQPTEMLPPVEQ